MAHAGSRNCIAGWGTDDGAQEEWAPAEAAFDDYRHDTKRKNNPPAPLAAEGKMPAAPRLTYSYSPRLDPKLRFYDSGHADRLHELLQAEHAPALTADEVQILAEALAPISPGSNGPENGNPGASASILSRSISMNGSAPRHCCASPPGKM